MKLAREDQPLYRAQVQGLNSLTDSELISLLITGSPEKGITAARAALQAAENDLHTLAKRHWKELTEIENIGERAAMAITAAMELSRRRWCRDTLKRSEIRSSSAAYDLLMPHLIDLQQEEFWVILLNQACKVLHYQKVGTGGVTSVPFDIKLIFKLAVTYSATQMVLAHNHPSGRTTASQSDIALTERTVNAAKLIDVRVIDHIIIGESGYFSFADENMI